MHANKQPKKTWITPKLTIYGDVEKITREMPGPPGGGFRRGHS
jgi:hypothetical protein